MVLYGDHKDHGSDNGWKGGILGDSINGGSVQVGRKKTEAESLAGDRVMILNSTSQADMNMVNDLVLEDI